MGIDSEDDDVLYSSNMYLDQNRTLMGGEAKNLDEIMNKPRDRMKKTFGLCAAFFGLGLSVAILGPTLRSLKGQVGAASMENMAIVFSGRGLGYLGGTIAGGAFFECWNPQVLMALGLGMASVGILIVAFTKNLPFLVVMMSTVGIAMGILDTGANVVCIRMWGKKASAFLQMLHFGFALGAFFAPLLATPFLRGDLALNPNITCVQQCIKVQCQNGGTCSVGDNGTETCTCVEGFTGKLCGEKQCTKQCQNGGTCSVGDNSTETCLCVNGFKGDLCQDKECKAKKCKNAGTCSVEEDGTETCTCTAGFIGDLCQDKQCETNNCQNGGTCDVGEDGTETCNCVAGFTGERCEEPLGPPPVRKRRENAVNCSSTHCMNNGTCIEGDKGQPDSCECADGFKGNICEAIYCQVDNSPCMNGGTCTPGANDKPGSCQCADGFKGDLCEGCDPDYCGNNGTCDVTDVGRVTCNCTEGFTGDQCQDKLCETSPCQNNGTCIVGANNTKVCECKDGFEGKHCQGCDPDYCQNDGTCAVRNHTVMCTCTDDFTGSQCEDKKCMKKECQNGGTCSVTDDGAETCNCTKGFTGEFCEDQQCETKHCVNDGTCTVKDNVEMCTCKDGFVGDICQDKICTTMKCQNNGTCITGSDGQDTCRCKTYFKGDLCEECDPDQCHKRGACNITEEGNVICNCTDGFTGNQCQDVDCKRSPCKYNGTCIEGEKGQKGKKADRCECADGFTGDICDECNPAYCHNGGTCAIGKDGVTCACKGGFTGDQCEAIDCQDDNAPCINGGTCTPGENNEADRCECAAGIIGDICEACDPDYCSNGAMCNITENTVTCNCTEGYTGEKCEDVDCKQSPCKHGGTCIEGEKTKKGKKADRCKCADGFTGDICDACDESFCENGGKCVVDGDEVKCNCSKGFNGDRCEGCEDSNCLHGGTCSVTDEKNTCSCQAGFKGAMCEYVDCKHSPCMNNGTCIKGDKDTPDRCECTDGFKGDICEAHLALIAPTGFRGVYIIISIYLAAICILFCYFTYISPITSESSSPQKPASDRPSYENQILLLLFCFYLIYVGSEVSFGGYISEYHQAVFKDCHGSLATAWFWGTFALGRGLAIFIASVTSPMKMLVTDLVGGIIASVILVLFGDVSMWFWVGTGLLGLSMASMFPAGIAWLEGYVDVSGKVASVLVTGGVLGEMLIPLTVGYLMFDKQEGLGEQVYPDRLMYLMCVVCVGSSLIFGYVYMLAKDMGLKNTHQKQHSATDVLDGMKDAFSMRNMDSTGPRQLKKPPRFGKKHKI